MMTLLSTKPITAFAQKLLQTNPKDEIVIARQKHRIIYQKNDNLARILHVCRYAWKTNGYLSGLSMKCMRLR